MPKNNFKLLFPAYVQLLVYADLELFDKAWWLTIQEYNSVIYFVNNKRMESFVERM